ncbi:MAG: hypothetical protein F4085_07635 [Acidimicrobiia bacterium]|nr:hypothetical protein [Acidimicrobiia bacterium]
MIGQLPHRIVATEGSTNLVLQAKNVNSNVPPRTKRIGQLARFLLIRARMFRSRSCARYLPARKASDPTDVPTDRKAPNSSGLSGAPTITITSGSTEIPTTATSVYVAAVRLRSALAESVAIRGRLAMNIRGGRNSCSGHRDQPAKCGET